MKKFPIVSFFMMAWLLGAGIILLVFRGILPGGLALTSVIAASLAGIVMTAVSDGRPGLKLMLSRLLIWRVGIGYWLFALLFPAAAIFLGSFFNPFTNGDPIGLANLKPTSEILPVFIIFFIVTGLGQELGWTGFLIPQLQARFSALVSAVIRAFLVGIWHVPLLILSWLQPYAFLDFPYGSWIAQKGFLVIFLTLLLILILPWSIFFTWIFNNSKGSLLLTAVLHGSEIWVAYWMLSAGINPNNFDNFWGYGMVMVLTAILIVFISGPQNLSRKHIRIVCRPSPKQESLVD